MGRLIDFQGLVDLDPSVIEKLQIYLQERETQLAHRILDAIHPLPPETYSPILPLTGVQLKLSEAIEGFTKKVRSFTSDTMTQKSNDEAERTVEDLNAALWDYVEVLEGSVVELFEQANQVNVDRWHISLKEVVHSIKDLLLHKFEDVIWAIKRLEAPLKSYCQKCQKTEGWRSLFSQRDYLDPGLLKNLQQSEEYLKKNDATFKARYSQFEKLNGSVELSLKEMKSFPILALLDLSVQNTYLDVFRLLKMLGLNRKSRGDLADGMVRSLKNLASVDSIIKTFKTYYLEMEASLFRSSHELKSLNQHSEAYRDQLIRLKGKVENFKNELKELNKNMGEYRSFILKTDPNPYVSSRWGFSEWIVGPEPVNAKKMMNLIYSGTELLNAFEGFQKALERDPLEHQKKEIAGHQEIEKLLHEMSQPLISRSMMQSRAEKLLAMIEECDEVGNPNREVVDYVGYVLAKAMREDWKYHVLHGFQAFHEMMRYHKGLAGVIKDPTHAFRLNRFKELFDQIEKWAKNDNLASHAYEVELDVNDMKTYLQDFLASVQRAEKERSHNPFLDETVEKFKIQLLEYRYLFGQFFYLLMNKNRESQQLRNQFLFVDQYFETVESQLAQLAKSWHR